MIKATALGSWPEIESHLRRYVARRIGSTSDVDDVIQQIMVRIHGGLPGLLHAERFGPWAYRIARHAIADAARARASDPLVRVADIPYPMETDGGAHDEASVRAREAADLQADLLGCVAQFVARLPSAYREAVTLTELQGLTQRDAAAALGISLSGMKSRVQRGRQKIRDMFDECCRISVDCRGQVVDCEARALEEVPHDCRAAATAWIAKRGR